ncbi:MAG TPA: hypothetical protein VML58_21945 [Burkholderiaceae bacterium]|nr:hypothetical protein [Burkholderiaceae bacterium]
MSTSALFVGLLFGSLGMGYCVYGRRQHALVPFVCGLLLIAVPYLIANAAGLAAVGALLAALPFIVKL